MIDHETSIKRRDRVHHNHRSRNRAICSFGERLNEVESYVGGQARSVESMRKGHSGCGEGWCGGKGPIEGKDGGTERSGGCEGWWRFVKGYEEYGLEKGGIDEWCVGNGWEFPPVAQSVRALVL